MTKDLRFCIIGCGNIASRHAACIGQHGVLTAVCDIVPEKAAKLADQYNAKIYCSIDELLKDAVDFDIAVICTPNGLHAQHSIKCLDAGLHVLCEKPMAIEVDDCQKMIDASKKAARLLYVVKQNRFNPPVEAVKLAIDEKRLGKIFSIQLNCFWNRNNDYYKDSWRGSMEMDGGVLFTQFSHFIDLIYWIFGDIKKVQAYMKNYAHATTIDFEDTGVVILEFQNGIIGTINYTINSFKENFEGSLSIFGENGTIKIGGKYLNTIDYQNVKGYCIDLPPFEGKANDYGSYQGSMNNHGKVYSDFIELVKRNEPAVPSTTIDGLKTVEIIKKIYELRSSFN